MMRWVVFNLKSREILADADTYERAQGALEIYKDIYENDPLDILTADDAGLINFYQGEGE